MEQQLDYAAVRAAAARTAGAVRPAAVVPASPGVWYALEYLQHTGSFKARGAHNFLAAHREAGRLPAAGVTIASGGNAGLACAWAARAHGIPATVFLPGNAPRVKVDRLRGYGADVRLVGDRYAEALAACREFAAGSGALSSHAYDHPLVSAGAGTLLDEVRAALPGLDTVVVAVGGGGLFAGVATAAREHGVRVVAGRARALPGPERRPGGGRARSTSRWPPSPPTPSAPPASRPTPSPPPGTRTPCRCSSPTGRSPPPARRSGTSTGSSSRPAPPPRWRPCAPHRSRWASGSPSSCAGPTPTPGTS
ncbi:LOW QUALITY PROTEIN: threonine dehydratase, partial [Streptomyces sp. C]